MGKIFVIGILVLAHASGVAAQAAPLSMKEAVDIATAQNLDIAATERQLDAMRLRPDQERALPPPMAGLQIWQWPTNTLNPWKTNFYMPMVSQEFPGRGKRGLLAAVAERDVDLAASDVVVRQRDVVAMVKQAYVELAFTRKAIDVHLASVDVLHQVADISQAKYAAGSATQQDVLKSVTEASMLHDDLLMLEQDETLAAARLNSLLNRPTDAPIGQLDVLDERSLSAAPDVLRAKALEVNPELVEARKQVERSRAELAVARQDRKPDFSAQAGYMVMPNQTDSVMVQGTMTWPNAPWARRKFDLRVQETQAQITAAQARVTALENETRLHVDTAYQRALTAQRRLSLVRTTLLPQSRQTLDVSRVGYQAGQSDVLAVLDNQRMLLSAQLNYDKALADFYIAVADLERATGADLPADALRPIAEEVQR